MADHRFRIVPGAATSAVRPTAALAQMLARGLAQGGDPIFQLFATNLEALNTLSDDIATGGPAAWIEGVDRATGLPTFSVVSGDSQLVLGIYVPEDGRSALAAGTGRSGEGSFVEVAFAYANLVTGTGANAAISQVATNGVEYAGPGIPNIEAGNALATVIKRVATSVKTYLARTIELLSEIGAEETPAAVSAAASSKAEEAARSASVTDEPIAVGNGATVVADIVISAANVATAVLAVGQVALAQILPLLSKQITSFVRVYNEADVDVDVSVCWMKEGVALVASPMLPQAPVTVRARGPAWTPPSIIGTDALHYIDLAFVNTDALEGIAFVLKAAPGGGFPGFNVMVDIPVAGANSLQASFGTADDACADYWAQHQGGPAALTHATSSGRYTLAVATNQLRGRSPSPVDGAEGYNYEHVIAIRPSGA